MAPLVLGASLVIRYRFLPIFRTFLGDLVGRFVVLEYSHMTIVLYDHCFFFRNRPLEELPHQSCRAFRGEVDSSIPRVSGGLLVAVFEA